MFQAESQNLRTRGKCRTLKPGVGDAGLAMEQHRGQGCGWVDKRQVGRLGGWGDSQGLASNFRASPSNWEPLLSFYSLLSPPSLCTLEGSHLAPGLGWKESAALMITVRIFFSLSFFFSVLIFLLAYSWHTTLYYFCCTAKWFNHTYICILFYIFLSFF